MINIEFKTANGDITNPLGTFKKGNSAVTLDLDYVPTPNEIPYDYDAYPSYRPSTSPAFTPVNYGVKNGEVQMLFPFCN